MVLVLVIYLLLFLQVPSARADNAADENNISNSRQR